MLFEIPKNAYVLKIESRGKNQEKKRIEKHPLNPPYF